jgi:hypothetical protein
MLADVKQAIHVNGSWELGMGWIMVCQEMTEAMDATINPTGKPFRITEEIGGSGLGVAVC